MADPSELVPCTTSDGLSLALRRIRPRGAHPRGPLIMQHGLGSNGFIFDCPGRSLSTHLASRGFDCYVAELRGAGQSDRPKGPWGIDEYVEIDIPAILAAVKSASGAERVSWLGHSLGGILGMFYAMEHPGGPIARLVAVASALDYRPGRSSFRELRKLRWVAGDWMQFLPFGAIARLSAKIAGRGPALAPEKMNFRRSNVEAEILRAALARGFAPIPIRLFDDLDTTFSERGFSRKRGEIRYLDRARDLRVPTCLIAGARDVQCSILAVEATARLLVNAPEVQVSCFGKAFGQVDDYGHFDLVIGRRAERETWPTILTFLEKAVADTSDASAGDASAGRSTAS
ncbi:MAG: alpha/beta fold hydrolase [Polyangiaceae bacterium]